MLRSLLTLAFLLMSARALAVDGVIEISQAKALAGGVTGSVASDPPGFPVILTVQGSYRLTSDLTLSALGQTAIQIDTNDVTVDLNGFTIRGPWTSGACTAPPNGVGVLANVTLTGVAVKNGRIRGMSIHGVALLGFGAHVEHIQAIGNCVTGIFVGDYSRVSRSEAIANSTGHGIATGRGSFVTDSLGALNGLFGILGNGAGVNISGSIAISNKDDGIVAVDGLVATSISEDNGTTPGTGVFNPGDLGIRGGLVVDSLSNRNRGVAVISDSMAHVSMVGNGGLDVQGNLLGCIRLIGATYCPTP